MPLQFILGSSGSGKSRYLYETVIRESLAAPKENFLVLVPEQFTMEIQRNLTELHPRKGSCPYPCRGLFLLSSYLCCEQE